MHQHSDKRNRDDGDCLDPRFAALFLTGIFFQAGENGAR